MKNKTVLAMAITTALAMTMGTARAQSESTQAAPNATATTQVNAKNLQAVTVTGSRIRNVDLATAQPVYTMTRADIKNTGLTSVSDLLSRLPSVGAPDITSQDSLLSGPDVGGTYVNLRNLGSARTLVLVNGRRWSTSSSGLTDLSTIPTTIIDHIDVLKDGGSSIYGSDAIGGVINIVTIDHFDGAEANVYYGQNQHGDGQDTKYDFTTGWKSGKLSSVVSITHQETKTVWDSSRDLSSSPYGPRHPLDGWGEGNYGRVTDPNTGDSLAINHPGGVVGDTRNLGNYHPYVGDNSDQYNTNQQTVFRAPDKLNNVFIQERYDLSDKITLHGSFDYSSRESFTQIAGYPLQTSSGNLLPAIYQGLPAGLYIDPNNYYNPFPGSPVSFNRRTTEFPRGTDSRSNQLRYEIGANGYFNIGDREWDWDATYSYNNNKIRQNLTGNLNLLHAQQALGPSVTTNGVPQCADPAAVAAGCQPWNILAGPGGTPQSLWNYLLAPTTSHAGNSTKDFTVNLNGGLFDLPAGTVNLAVGYEYRDLNGYVTPDPLDSAGVTTNLASQPTKGGYNVNEAYAELDVPLLKDLPGAKELAFNVASRFSHYSRFGNTTNNKYSFRWRPIDDLLVRGTYAQGFRAPTIDDFAGGSGQSFESYLDPCDSVNGARAGDAAVAARCAAAGVPANYRQIQQNGTTVGAGGGQTPTPFTVGSNPNIKPETSVTRTFGIVYSPQYIDGLNVSLDYYDIRVKNLIQTIGSNAILNSCYVQGLSSFCNDFTRNPDGTIATLNDDPVNLGKLKTQGYDFDIIYHLPKFSFGQLTFTLDSTYLVSYDLSPGLGAPAQGLAGFYDALNVDNNIFPRIRANASLDWNYDAGSLGIFGATWTMRYTSGMKDSCDFAPDECNLPNYTNSWIGSTGVQQRGGVTFNDLQVRYTGTWKGTVSFGVNNIFNRRGPFYYNQTDATGVGPAYSPLFDIDRYFYLSYSQKF